MPEISNASGIDNSDRVNWTQINGPPGGRINQLVQNPKQPDELYALTGSGLVYKSVDKGEHWVLIELAAFSITASMYGVFFAGGPGLRYYDGVQSTNILNRPMSAVMVSGDKIFVTLDSVNAPTLLYSQLGSGAYVWQDISPTQEVLNCLVPPPSGSLNTFSIVISKVVVVGNRILANIVLTSSGSGEYTNGQLFCSDNLGANWYRSDLNNALGTVITDIFQQPSNPQHLVLAYKHTLLQQAFSPISSLLRESIDGGTTWETMTNLTLSSNGITNINRIGSTYYFVCAYDNLILKLAGEQCTQISFPTLPGAPGAKFGVDTLIFDSDSSQIVYGYSSGVAYGMFKSIDGMQTWKIMNNGIIASSPTIILPHPSDPNSIIASGNVVEFKYSTNDSGTTWQPFVPLFSVDEIKIDPFDQNHLIVVDENSNMYESYDFGKTYTQINNGFYASKISAIEIANDNPEKVYASSIGVAISKYSSTTDWQILSGSPDYAYVFKIDPLNSDILYAAYSPKNFENYSALWRYNPNQARNFGWTEIARFENSSGITSLEFDLSNANNMYVGVTGVEGTVYKSNDHGSTWQKINKDLTFTTIWGHSQLQIDPQNKDIAYAGTWGGGTYKTMNAGKDWTLLDTNHTYSPTWIAVSDTNPNIVYACDRLDAKIHRSNDGGQTWYTYFDFGKNYLLTAAVAIDPTDPNTIFVSAFSPPMAHEGSFVKIRDGQKIADMTSQLPRSVIAITIDKQNPSTIFVTTHIYSVYKSTDAGITWNKLDDNGKGLPRTGFYDVEIDPIDSNTVYATALSGQLPGYIIPSSFLNLEGNCGVYQSKDGGTHWTQILQTVSEARGITIDPQNTKNLYVADMCGGVWVSTNGGLNWRQENTGLGSISMTSVKVKDRQIYASTQGSGVYSGTIQSDGTIIWDIAKSNKPKAYVSTVQIKVDPVNSNCIYASGYPGGLLRSDDCGVHWNDKNFLTPSIKVDDPIRQGYYFFDIDPTNSSRIWLGAYGKGMFVSYDRMEYDMPANGDNNIMAGKHIRAVKINPNNPREVYVGTEEGVFMTQDEGHNWQPLNAGLRTLDVRCLSIGNSHAPPYLENFEDAIADGWNLYTGWEIANDHGNHMLQGTGHTWAIAGSQNWKDYTFTTRVKLLEGGAVHVNFRYSLDGRYFVGFNSSSLYLSKQYDNWTKFSDPINFPANYTIGQWCDLKIDLVGGNIKIYIDNKLVGTYTDSNPLTKGTIAFENLVDTSVYIDDVNVTHKTASELYVGTGGYGVYHFDSSKNIWQNIGRGFGVGWWSAWERRMYQFSSLVFDPTTPGKVYMGHFPGGFYISQDYGHTWKESSLGLGNDGIFTLILDPSNASVLWAGTYNGVSKSIDGGKTWQNKSSGMPSEQWPFTVAVDNVDKNIMYIATKNGQNKGLSYRNQFLGVVMKSIDGGETWFKIMNGLSDQNEYYKLLIYPLNHNVLFLSSSNGVFLSEDAGVTWKPINKGLPTTSNQVRDNVADNLAFTCDNKTLLLGLVNNGLWQADLTVFEVSSPSSTPTPSPSPSANPTPSVNPTSNPTSLPTSTPLPTNAPTQDRTQTPNPSTNPFPTPTIPEFAASVIFLFAIVASSIIALIMKERKIQLPHLHGLHIHA